MIKVWGYRREFVAERAETEAAMLEVFRSGKLILGDQVAGFEREFAAYCGVAHGVGVANGTDALFLALRALEVGPGDEVITVPNTAVPTVAAITATGATPVLVDIDPATYLMDVSLVEAAITARTKAILPVHLYGQCVDVPRLRQIIGNRPIRILEDCAQSHGARFGSALAGSMGDIAAFSFYPTKILGTYGDGGMCITNDPALNAKLRRLRFYGMEETYYSLEQGYNSRLDELHAAILRRKLNHMPDYLARRAAIAARYDEALAATALTLPARVAGGQHAFYIYVVRHPERDRVMSELAARKIMVNISYRWPIHTMPAFAHLGYPVGAFPHTERVAAEIFSLPMYPSLTDQEVEVVIGALREIA